MDLRSSPAPIAHQRITTVSPQHLHRINTGSRQDNTDDHQWVDVRIIFYGDRMDVKLVSIVMRCDDDDDDDGGDDHGGDRRCVNSPISGHRIAATYVPDPCLAHIMD